MSASRWIACFVAGLISQVLSFAAPASVNGFDAANKLYEQGRYGEAVLAYEALQSGGQTSPALLYNLGNARFKSGRIGKALGAYVEAAHLSPRDPDIRANLQFARKQVQGPTLTGNAFHSWLSRLTLNEWSVSAAVLVWLLFAQMIGAQLWPAAKAALRPWTLSTAGLGLLVILGMVAAFSLEKSGRYAVVVVSKVAAHSSPFEGSDKTFDLQDGAEVRILDEKEDWIQATTDARRTGWIQKRNVDFLLMRP